MFAAGEGHSLRAMEVNHFVQGFQPLLEHRFLTFDIGFQRLRLFCGGGKGFDLLLADCNFIQRRFISNTSPAAFC
ncbi:hypothetical protein C0557_17725 [Kosakonia sp. MUSA4]|nr:hypothetical protein C0557_17725 [Kosakonia sp. MUSA4]